MAKFTQKLTSKFKNSKFDFVKNFYYGLIVPVILIILGLTFIFTINFNLSNDFGGYSVATVVINSDLENSENYIKATKDIESVLKENDVKSVSYQIVENGYPQYTGVSNYKNSITVKFENEDSAKLNDINADLVSKFFSSVDKTYVDNLTNNTLTDEQLSEKLDEVLADLVDVSYVAPNIQMSVLTSAMLAIVAAAVVLFIYVALRFSVGAAFITLTMSLLDVLLAVCAVSVFRIEFSSYVIGAFMLAFVVSTLAQIMFFNRAKQNLAKEKYEKLTNKEIANITVKDNFYRNMMFACITLVFAFLLGIIPGAAISAAAITAVIATLLIFSNSVFITPVLFAITHIRKQKKIKIEADEKQTKTDKNDFSKMAEVIKEKEVTENTDL